MPERTGSAVEERVRIEEDSMESTQAMRPEDLPRRDDRRFKPRPDPGSVSYADTIEPTAPLYRNELRTPETSATQQMDPSIFDDTEQQRRTAEREERARMLGVMSREGLDTEESFAPVVKPKRTTDKWHGAMAFFVLRVVVAGIVGLWGYQHLTHLTRTQEFFANSVLPQPNYIAWGFIIAEFTVAFLLLFGLLTRFAGLALMVMAGILIAFFDWGTKAIITGSEMGFKGDFHFVLAAAGFVFLMLGAGGWALDHAFRHGRERARQRRELGDPV